MHTYIVIIAYNSHKSKGQGTGSMCSYILYCIYTCIGIIIVIKLQEVLHELIGICPVFNNHVYMYMYIQCT